MKESPKRFNRPFLSDGETNKVNCTPNLDDREFDKTLEPSNVAFESFKKPKEVYIDKNVTECQLPEMVTCYEESCFNAVKDICVDEGLFHEEIIKCDRAHHELSCDSYTDDGDKHDHMNDDMMIKDDLDTQLVSAPVEDKIKLFAESNTVNSNEPDNLMENGEEKSDTSSDLLNNSIRILESTDNRADDVDQQLSEAQSAGSEANERRQRQTNHTTDTPNEIMPEENMNSSYENVEPTTASGPHELQLSTESAPNHNDLASSNITVAPRGGGESSFSMADPVSGHITYSGPVTAFGSISHRSDGSNSSVRSFAFPILQNEWNSSPVRMAKANPKHSRKQRGWRQALMCCRF